MKPSDQTVKAFTVAMVNAMLRVAEGLYGLKRSRNDYVSVTTRAARSRGGMKGGAVYLSLHTGYITMTSDDHKAFWTEYGHVNEDAEIGASGWVHWTDYVRILCAHEVAHVVQFMCPEAAKRAIERMTACGKAELVATAEHRVSAVDKAGHMADWQAIYRELRTLTA